MCIGGELLTIRGRDLHADLEVYVGSTKCELQLDDPASTATSFDDDTVLVCRTGEVLILWL